MRIAIGEYRPDAPPGAPASARIENLVPRTETSYGPMPSLQPFSGNALAERCQGAYAAVDAAGNGYVFAGDRARLYRMSAGLTAFSDVTSTMRAYATDGQDRWCWTQFGQAVLATNFADPIQYLPMAGTHFEDLAAGAPRAKHLAVVRDFLVAGFTASADGIDPQRIQWSAINDPRAWPTPGTSGALGVQSDFQTIAGEQGWLTGIVANLGFADAAVFFERAIFRMQYAGSPLIFAFSAAEGARGTQAPGSIAQLGAVVYYLGEDGFYAFDGSNSRAIGAGRIDKSFFADLDQNQLHRISSTVDPINKLVFWAYPGSDNVAGTPNRLLVYNVALDRWARITGIECETLFRAVSIGSSIDSLDATGLTLDQLPLSLDSRAWSAGKPLLAAFDAQHRLAYFSGPALPALAESPEIEPFLGRRALVTAARPLVDGADAEVAIATRDRLSDAAIFGLAIGVDARGVTPQRAGGRYLRARISMPAGASFLHLTGIDLDLRAEGRR